MNKNIQNFTPHGPFIINKEGQTNMLAQKNSLKCVSENTSFTTKYHISVVEKTYKKISVKCVSENTTLITRNQN